ncbi:PACE efflux transporter [Pollutimonas harenae]|uniref:PACE efflux transporter n=1 Tax=Pollutimonas harenae TaxID=657015 RepID=A0A853GXG2_9BURK|nr:PACE efflux transporter [Pollutimonas harenae]NYT86837.1 PACE efflux transporter [Pollutimonas harenae]TEA71480.1 PACE efflux transporter [Pollutimonas harenae]
MQALLLGVILFYLSPIKRRVLYVTLFEILAVLFATLMLAALSGGNAQQSLPIAIAVSAIAVAWNYIYNTLFEAWERRSGTTDRTLLVRSIHAMGFEGGLLAITLPLYMFWYNVGAYKAFTMVAALLLFFLLYTFIFTLLFDKVFVLPNSRQPTHT